MAHQTFWKPEKKVKEKKTYNSLQSRKNKPKKEVSEWKKDILSHHQSKPSRADRAEFPIDVVKELIKEADGKCQCGCGQADQETHHVYPRGRGGRGVKRNGMRVNAICHQRIQTSEDELQHWINVYTQKFGDYFWFDEQDWDEHKRKQAAEDAAEQEKQLRMQQIEPVVNLLSAAAGRKLRAKEVRLIEGLNGRQIATLTDLMTDVVKTTDKLNKPFGYGHFDD